MIMHMWSPWIHHFYSPPLAIFKNGSHFHIEVLYLERKRIRATFSRKSLALLLNNSPHTLGQDGRVSFSKMNTHERAREKRALPMCLPNGFVCRDCWRLQHSFIRLNVFTAQLSDLRCTRFVLMRQHDKARWLDIHWPLTQIPHSSNYSSYPWSLSVIKNRTRTILKP